MHQLFWIYPAHLVMLPKSFILRKHYHNKFCIFLLKKMKFRTKYFIIYLAKIQRMWLLYLFWDIWINTWRRSTKYIWTWRNQDLYLLCTISQNHIKLQEALRTKFFSSPPPPLAVFYTNIWNLWWVMGGTLSSNGMDVGDLHHVKFNKYSLCIFWHIFIVLLMFHLRVFYITKVNLHSIH